ncbi:unnamed protein product [Cunninghamella echinulata]
MGTSWSVEMRKAVHEPVLNINDKSLKLISTTHDIAFPSPLPQWTDNDNVLLKSILGETIRADLLTTHEDKIDFKQMTSQQRVFKSLFLYFDNLFATKKYTIDTIQDSETLKPIWELYSTLEHQLYPWIQPRWKNVFEINSNYQDNTVISDNRGKNSSGSRGIVMCVGNGQMPFAIQSLHAIQNVLKSQLPIEVVAINDNDLSAENRDTLLSTFKNIEVYNIVDRIGPDGTDFGGWSLKPYAILASEFQEVILMDADVNFFSRPELLLNDAGYLKTGSLFFYDRTLFGDWITGRRWLSYFLPSMSSLVHKTRWWNYRSAHEQESGVVLINKKMSLLGLLSSCKMNGKRERDEVSYQHIHGDKETFWVGYEMVQSPYAFIKSFGGVIGGLDDGGDPSHVCGNILHFDSEKRPLWWNGGLLRDKHKWSDRYLKFTHYAYGEDWDFANSCIKNTDQIFKLEANYQELAKQYIKQDKQSRNIKD